MTSRLTQQVVKKAYVKALRRQGYTYERIGLTLGLTRQRIQQIVGSRGHVKPKRTSYDLHNKCINGCGNEVGRKNSRCVTCARKRRNKLQRERYQVNPVARSAQIAAINRWKKNHPHAVRVLNKRAGKRYWQRNRTAILAKNRERYHTDASYRQKILAASKAWYRRNTASPQKLVILHLIPAKHSCFRNY